MTRAELATLPAPGLPADLGCRVLAREGGGGPTATLRDAVDAAMDADPSIPGTPESILAVLRAMPPSYRFLAAVDAGGAVQATAASGRFGRFAVVSFVTTRSAHRRRGIATALTARALVEARSQGATAACLESSPDGLSVYRALGFEPAGSMTLVSRM